MLPACVCKLPRSRLTPCGEFVHDGLAAHPIHLHQDDLQSLSGWTVNTWNRFARQRVRSAFASPLYYLGAPSPTPAPAPTPAPTSAPAPTPAPAPAPAPRRSPLSSLRFERRNPASDRSQPLRRWWLSARRRLLFLGRRLGWVQRRRNTSRQWWRLRLLLLRDASPPVILGEGTGP